MRTCIAALYTLAVEATEAYEAGRTAVAGFVNAWAREGVVFTRGTTESINLVASSWGRTNVQRGDRVVVTAMDHHSNIVPWQILCQEKGRHAADGRDHGRWAHRCVGLRSGARVQTQDRGVPLCLEFARDGESGRAAHQVGARPQRVTVVDGAQAAPHLRVDVQAMDCDFFRVLRPQDAGADGPAAP